MANEELRRVKTYVGATGRLVRLQMRDPDTGAANDISSATSATISARLTGESAYKIQAAALTIEAGTDGWVNFYPTADEIDTEDDMRAQVRLVYPADVDFCNEFILEVEDPIHYTP